MGSTPGGKLRREAGSETIDLAGTRLLGDGELMGAATTGAAGGGGGEDDDDDDDEN